MHKGFGSPQFCALRYQAIGVFVVFRNFCSSRLQGWAKYKDWRFCLVQEEMYCVHRSGERVYCWKDLTAE